MQSIIEALRCNSSERALEFYAAAYRSIVETFDDVSLLRRLVFSSHTQQTFSRVLARNDTPVLKHMDVLAGDAEYRDYTRLTIAETLTCLPRIVLRRLRRHRAAHDRDGDAISKRYASRG